MKSVIVPAPGKIEIREVETPVINAYQALVKTEMVALVHMQVEVIRRLRQIECRILRHDTIYTDITAHFYQRQYGIDYYIESYSINHGIVRTIGGGYKLRRADFGRCISVVRTHPAGYFQFGGKHIDDVNLPQAEQLAQLDEAQSYRT